MGPILFSRVHITSARNFFWDLIKARDGQPPPLAQAIRYWLQSGNLWVTDTLVIHWPCLGQFADLGTKRDSCERIDKLARTSIIDWLEKAEGVGQGLLMTSGWNR